MKKLTWYLLGISTGLAIPRLVDVIEHAITEMNLRQIARDNWGQPKKPVTVPEADLSDSLRAAVAEADEGQLVQHDNRGGPRFE